MTDMPDLIKHIIEITEEHQKKINEEQKKLNEEQKILKLREQRRIAMEKYRKKNLEKWRERAKKIAKAQYDRRKEDPDFLKAKCESSKASYHRRKQREQNE